MSNSLLKLAGLPAIFLLLTSFRCVNTHDMTVYGKVTNAAGTPISGVKISVDPRTAFSHVYDTTSDEFGMYKVDEGQVDLFYVNEALDPTHEITVQAVHPNYKLFKKDLEFKEDKYRFDIIMEQ